MTQGLKKGLRSVCLVILLALSGVYIYGSAHATITEGVARNEYTGNGATKVFTYNFRITDEEHIAVYVGGVLKTLSTDYSVGGVDNPTGTVTFVTAPASGVAITLLRNQPIEQISDYILNEGFPSDRVEKDLDKLNMIAQMQDEKLGRALKFAPESTFEDVEFPDPESGKYVRANGSGYELATLPAAAVNADLIAGDVRNVNDFADFETAIATIGGTTSTLAIPDGTAVSADTTVPRNVTLWFLGSGDLSVASTKTLTVNGPIMSPPRQIFSGAGTVLLSGLVNPIYPQYFGALGDGVNDDTAEIQAAFNALNGNTGTIFFPAGTYKITSPIDVPDLFGKGRIEGAGASTVIKPVGVSAFTFKGEGYNRTSLSYLTMHGDNTAGVAAIDTSPTITSDVFSGVTFHDFRIRDFLVAFKMKNAQINYFRDFDVDFTATGGVVFQMVPDSGSGQNVNSNRAHRMRVTGADAQIFSTTLPTSTERATNWILRECDIQVSGTTVPITIKDSLYIIDSCEFENSTAPHLIELSSANSAAIATETVLLFNNLIGTNTRKVYVTGTEATKPSLIAIGNSTGTGVTAFEYTTGSTRPSILMGNLGQIDLDSGGRHILEIGNSNSGIKKAFGAINRGTGNDTIGVIAGALSSSTTLGKNLTGSATFSSASTVAVSFDPARAEPDASYKVLVTGSVNETFWITSKATTGFTINSSNGTSTANVDWFILR